MASYNGKQTENKRTRQEKQIKDKRNRQQPDNTERPNGQTHSGNPQWKTATGRAIKQAVQTPQYPTARKYQQDRKRNKPSKQANQPNKSKPYQTVGRLPGKATHKQRQTGNRPRKTKPDTKETDKQQSNRQSKYRQQNNENSDSLIQ